MHLTTIQATKLFASGYGFDKEIECFCYDGKQPLCLGTIPHIYFFSLRLFKESDILLATWHFPLYAH